MASDILSGDDLAALLGNAVDKKSGHGNHQGHHQFRAHDAQQSPGAAKHYGMVHCSCGHERRVESRYAVRWKSELHCDKHSLICHGMTNDLSMSGASILCDHNLKSQNNLWIGLHVRHIYDAVEPVLVRIRGAAVYTVLASNPSQFRVGIQFTEFPGNTRGVLAEALTGRPVVAKPNTYTGGTCPNCGLLKT